MGSARSPSRKQLSGLGMGAFFRYDEIRILVFYIEHPDHIDVWRVLHGQRDILAWMQEPDVV